MHPFGPVNPTRRRTVRKAHSVTVWPLVQSIESPQVQMGTGESALAGGENPPTVILNITASAVNTLAMVFIPFPLLECAATAAIPGSSCLTIK